ncbi:MAG TPA: phosphatase PAP2 family protein [Gemmatimonadaceae bacterium]|nr:phosphatase PAP2 family protein [Gemmatimonadaceae bacterium]
MTTEQTPALTLPRHGGGRGIAVRMVQRLWPLPAIYVAMLPAGLLRAYADDIGLPVRQHFNALERLLYAPEQTTWLQKLDFEWLRLAAAWTYASWFVLPLIVGLPLLVFRPGEFWRLGAFLVLFYYLAMPLFLLYPLSPPWLAHPEVHRTLAAYFEEMTRDSNPYAAMPSLHAAMPAAAALWYGWRHPYSRVLWAYAGLIGFAVVYGGEHYVADVLAGFLFAALVYRAAVALRLPLLPKRAALIVELSSGRAELRKAS